MSDMPERIYVDPHSPELDWCYAPLDEMFTEYIRADKYAELEARNKRLDEAAKAILEATIAETVEKAAFVDEMCKALGVTFEALVNDDSVKAGIKEKDDA